MRCVISLDFVLMSERCAWTVGDSNDDKMLLCVFEDCFQGYHVSHQVMDGEERKLVGSCVVRSTLASGPSSKFRLTRPFSKAFLASSISFAVVSSEKVRPSNINGDELVRDSGIFVCSKTSRKY